MGWKEITLAVGAVALIGAAIWKRNDVEDGIKAAKDFAANNYDKINDLLKKREAEAFRQELLVRRFDRVTEQPA